MRVAFCTLGCKVNQYDTEAMREKFQTSGYECVEFEQRADIYVINTCTVTQTGDKKSRQMISRARSRNPDAKIIVTGCYAQRAPDEVLNIDGVSLIIGTKDRSRIVELAQAANPDSKLSAVSDVLHEKQFEPLSTMKDEYTRAHLKIQEGCDRFCSYCIIPYVRGALRSRPLESVRTEFLQLAAAGYKEIVLTGIHLMSYGKDLNGPTLIDAIAQADDIDGIKRIRLGSLEPQLTDDAFISALACNKKICRQFHLSLQSGSCNVLKRMNRRYTPDEYEQCVQRLRSAMPGCAITTDIIVGFPGETDEEFNETLAFVKRIGFSRIHVFPFSRRLGTKAYDMPNQLPNRVKSERTAELIALGHELEHNYICRYIGTTQQVLFEDSEDGELGGYTDTYVRVRVDKNTAVAGKIYDVKIKGMTDLHLNGIITDK